MKNADLLAALVRDPDVLENWMIYADALLEEGDPRGELINLEWESRPTPVDADSRDPEGRIDPFSAFHRR